MSEAGFLSPPPSRLLSYALGAHLSKPGVAASRSQEQAGGGIPSLIESKSDPSLLLPSEPQRVTETHASYARDFRATPTDGSCPTNTCEQCQDALHGSLLALTRPSRSGTSGLGQGGVTQNAPAPQPGDRVTGSKLIQLPENVVIEVNASLLPPIACADGTVQRSVWMNAVCSRSGICV